MAKKKAGAVRAPKKNLDTLQRYTLVEAANFLRVSRSTLHLRIASGLISTIKEGGRVFVPGAEIARLSAPPAPRMEAAPASS